jgi:hypothetical protein
MDAMPLSARDEEYVRAGYFTLRELCLDRPEAPEQIERLIEDGRLPAPSHVLGDGTAMFPADYFLLVDEAGGIDRLESQFRARHRLAGGRSGDLDDDWDGYLSGVYGVCLRSVIPEAMIRKTELVEAIEELLERPDPADEGWAVSLRRSVWQLDQLLRPFSPDYDRSGHLPQAPSRDRLIADPRRRFASVFDHGVIA